MALIISLVLGGSAYTVAAITAPLPQVSPVAKELPNVTAVKVAIDWPAYGHAAIGAEGYGVLASSGEVKQVPMASIAKIVTALMVLDKKPLRRGHKGETLKMTSKDVALYQTYAAKNGSVVPVNEGEKLTQYQALQAMLLPSANNMADSLAIWAFGSIDAYINYANSTLKDYEITQTKIADASGFSPNTLSTAEDLVRLGIIALQHPVISEIVSQKSAIIPVAGTIRNVNRLLSTEGIVGIKTGLTDEAGGCLLFASKQKIEDKTVMLVGVLLGAPNRSVVFRDAIPLIHSSAKGFATTTLIKKDSVMGTYTAPWGESVDIVTSSDLSVFGWIGTAAQPKLKLVRAEPNAAAGTIAGTLEAQSGERRSTASLVTAAPLHEPDPLWRIKHYL